jgi:hypothetical protein
MNNYLKKYSNHFIGIGSVLLAMYFFNIVPYRFRNAPESLRLFAPIIFIIIGIIGKFIENEKYIINQPSQSINHELNNKNKPLFEREIMNESDFNFQNQQKKTESTNLTPNEWLKQNPGKTLNDYFFWRNNNV